MKSFFTLLLASSFTGLITFAQGAYAPGAGNSGTTAIYADSSIIKSWATGIELQRGWVNIADTSVKYGGTNKASFGYPSIALGEAQESSYDVVSLGDGGDAILTFSRPVANGAGADFAVFENGFSNGFLELAFVEVSSDGKRFLRFPAVSLTPFDTQVGSFGSLDPTNLYNLAGKYRQGYGTPFDLEDIKDSAGIDLNNVRFVKIVDAVGSISGEYASLDSKGNVVNDPWPTPYNSCGFDLDAVAVCNGGQPYGVATLDELSLEVDSRWTHAQSDTAFVSSGALFSSFVDDYGLTNGFAYSNMRDDSTAGYTNDYSAVTRGGMNATDTGGTNYAVAYVNSYSTLPAVWFSDKASHHVQGFYATNNTYAYLSMKNGDSYAKKFGGDSGSDADWFKLMVWGEKEDGSKTDTVDFYLADFRFTNNSEDYIVNDWRWVDVSSLGAVKSLHFDLRSSDNGTYGMNTPAYFCLDNLTFIPDTLPVTLSPLADVDVKVNAQPLTVSLATAFTAYDTTGMKLSLVSNDNTGLVQTSLSGKQLQLSFTPGETGEATLVVGATLDGETVTDTFVVKVSTATATCTTPNMVARAYPNPFSSSISVDCEPGSRVRLFDITGREVKNWRSAGKREQLSTEDLPRGLYLLEIEEPGGLQVIKMQK